MKKALSILTGLAIIVIWAAGCGPAKVSVPTGGPPGGSSQNQEVPRVFTAAAGMLKDVGIPVYVPAYLPGQGPFSLIQFTADRNGYSFEVVRSDKAYPPNQLTRYSMADLVVTVTASNRPFSPYPAEEQLFAQPAGNVAVKGVKAASYNKGMEVAWQSGGWEFFAAGHAPGDGERVAGDILKALPAGEKLVGTVQGKFRAAQFGNPMYVTASWTADGKTWYTLDGRSSPEETVKMLQSMTLLGRGPDTALPARVAYTSGNCLYLADGSRIGRRDGGTPVESTQNAAVNIQGWSPDGQWLMYTTEPSVNSNGQSYLWVARSDGSAARMVDQRSVLSRPSWSPVSDSIAYSTVDPVKGSPDFNLKIAAIGPGDKPAITTLLPENSGAADFAWSPDGLSLAVSFQRNGDHQPLIERVTLKGDRTKLINLDQPADESTNNQIYAWAATGLKWSPDGRYLAYHLQLNSASLSADGVDLQVLDLKEPGQPLDLGTVLSYVDWLAWSPDSKQLAYILGSGRETTANKHLYLADMQAGGKITDCGRAGQADT